MLSHDQYEENSTAIYEPYLESTAEKWLLDTRNNTMAGSLYTTDYLDATDIDGLARIQFFKNKITYNAENDTYTN